MSLQRLKALLTGQTYRCAVRKQLLLLVLGLAGVLVACGQLARAAAGPEPNDVQDSLPAWSSNGADIAFERTAANQLPRVLDMTAGGKSVHAVQDGQLRGFVPGTEHLILQPDGEHTVVVPDTGRAFQPIASYLGTDASASPDGTRLAYLRDGTLYVAAIDGSGERAIATGVAPPATDATGPAWSPDGRRIAIASGGSLLVVPTDGSHAPVVVGSGDSPSWPRDGSAIAYERQVDGDWTIWQVDPDGANAHMVLGERGSDFRFPQFEQRVGALSAALAYISDRQHVRGGATPYQYALYTRVPTGSIAKLLDDVHPYSPPRWNPMSTAIAVAAGQECRRWGVYLVPAGAQSRRLSNVCRFDGTAAADHLNGSPYFDIINGNGGNDVIHGLGGNDKISGENGNDTIVGGAGNDFILGGPGNDRISGGSGNDVIIGGNGRDVIDCGPGNDTVEGAGPLDRIAKNCEHVRR